MGSKKFVLKVDLHTDKDKQKAIKVVSKIPGIDSIAMNMKDMKLTVIGDIDPITVVSRLRKYWWTHITSVGPATQPEKKEDGDNKQKDGGGGGGGGGDPNDDDSKDDKHNKENGGRDEGDEGSSGEKKEDSADNDAFFLNLAAYNAWRSNAKMAHAAILILLAAVSEVQQWHSKALSLSDAATYNPNKRAHTLSFHGCANEDPKKHDLSKQVKHECY